MTPRLEWRIDPPLCGQENMRIDRQLWRQCEEGEREAPFLRVYGWSPPCLSLGFHQPLLPRVEERARSAGVDIVRRPTGGAAVLHDQEITYAVVGPLSGWGVGRSVRAIYEAVASSITDALEELGVESDRGGGGRPEGFACFAAAGGHEITVAGRKLVGSALRRGRHSFLQHGSLLTGSAHLRIAELMAPSESEASQARAELARRTIDLSQIPSAVEVGAAAFAPALARFLRARFAAA